MSKKDEVIYDGRVVGNLYYSPKGRIINLDEEFGFENGLFQAASKYYLEGIKEDLRKEAEAKKNNIAKKSKRGNNK